VSISDRQTRSSADVIRFRAVGMDVDITLSVR
jgi:hypothetical protein